MSPENMKLTGRKKRNSQETGRLYQTSPFWAWIGLVDHVNTLDIAVWWTPNDSWCYNSCLFYWQIMVDAQQSGWYEYGPVIDRSTKTVGEHPNSKTTHRFISPVLLALTRSQFGDLLDGNTNITPMNSLNEQPQDEQTLVLQNWHSIALDARSPRGPLRRRKGPKL